MDKAKRAAVIAGNWKMNKTPDETRTLINEIKPLVAGAKCEVIVCVPFVCLNAAIEECKGSNIKVGAQNCHYEKSGAFTGEISAPTLKAMGTDYVIIGHSERRQYFAETDYTVNKKVLSALEEGLKVIICVGETLSQREQGITDELVAMQTKAALCCVDEKKLCDIIIAYEPVWAIGTGKTASAEQADDVCEVIRASVASLFSDKLAQGLTIQYGGSMNPQNAAELLSKYNVDGGLIGGASLKAKDFSAIVTAASI